MHMQQEPPEEQDAPGFEPQDMQVCILLVHVMAYSCVGLIVGRMLAQCRGGLYSFRASCHCTTTVTTVHHTAAC
jgi:hypothetical protein